MPRFTATAYPKWKPTLSRRGNGVFFDDEPGNDRDSSVFCVRDPDDPAGMMSDATIRIPVGDFDYAIDLQGGIMPVSMSTNRVDRRDREPSIAAAAALQKQYKRAKGWIFFPDKFTTVDGRSVRVEMPPGTTVEAWIAENQKIIDQRRAKHLKDSTKNIKQYLPADEKMAATIRQALKDEREAERAKKAK